MTSMNAKPPADRLIYTRPALIMVLFWLLLGWLGWSLKQRAGQPIVQLLLANYGATENYSSALIGAIPAGITLFVFPLLGYFSDRYRSQWGRRIPFLAAIIPIAVISMAGIAASPWLGPQLDRAFGSSQPGTNSGTLSCLAVFWTMFAFADLLGTLLMGALANDVVPQQIMGRYFGASRAIGLLGGMGFNYYLFSRAETAYVAILLVLSAVVIITLGLMCLNVREGDYPLPPPDPKGWPEIGRDARAYLSECFGTPFYLLLFVAWALGSTAWNPVNYYSVLFSTGIITADHYGNLLTLTFAISFILAYPLGALADRFHPLRLAIAALAAYALATLWGGLFAHTPREFDVAFVLHGVLSGTFMTATASILQRLLPRLKFAQFASAAAVMICFWNLLIIPFAGVALNSMHQDFHCIFLLSSVLGWLGLISTIFLYRGFLARGGDRHYIAP